MEHKWSEIEILSDPSLQPEQEAVLDLHGLINALNVLHGELTVIGLQLAGDEDYLAAGMAALRALAASLRKPAERLEQLRRIEDYRQQVMRSVEEVLSRHQHARQDAEVAESLSNLESVFTILRWRAAEMIARADDPRRWNCVPIAELQRNFTEVFSAIEKNSKGRYRIIYNLAQQEPMDYYVRLDFSCAQGDRIFVPLVLTDVMRDLIANARKYTAPGGRILCGLYEDERQLRFVVEDTGRGIPAAEIPGVFEFGHRGSNVGDVRTMGGGFGLTKALRVTRQFGGRLWIASELDRGTRIRITLPRPAVVEASLAAAS